MGLPLFLCPGAFIPWNRSVRQIITLKIGGWIRSQENENEEQRVGAAAGSWAEGVWGPTPEDSPTSEVGAAGGASGGAPAWSLGREEMGPSRGPGPPVMAVSPWAAAEEAESRRARVLWCAVGPREASKCQQWSEQSAGKVTCATANTTEDCIALVLVGRRLPRDPASRARGTARL